MNKTKRFLIVLAVVGVALAFLWPTINWYFLTPKADQALALGSREQIRDLSAIPSSHHERGRNKHREEGNEIIGKNAHDRLKQ